MLRIVAAILSITTFSPSSAATKYETYIDSAEYYAGKEQFSKAAEYYRMALRSNPASPLNSMVFANLGLCLTETGNYSDAIEAYDVALVKSPRSAVILTNRAKTLILASKPSEALESLERAIEIEPADINARRLHGQLLLMDNRPNEALDDFKTVLDQTADDPSSIDGAARCHALLGNHQEAARLYRRRIEVLDEPESHIGLITALINDSQLDEADQCVYNAIDLYPRNGELYLLRGIIHNLHYRTKEAITDRKTAITLGVPSEIANRAIPATLPKK